MREPRWLDRFAVDQMHETLIRQDGGSYGTRDNGLIDSALARPVNRWSYDPACDLAALAASYGYGLAKNHGYVDGNKRIALAALSVFLFRNGLLVDAPEPEVVAVMLEVASGARGEEELAEWLRRSTVPLAG